MIFREGIFFLLRKNNTEMEKEDYIWRRKIFFFQKRTILGKKIRSKSGVGKYVF